MGPLLLNIHPMWDGTLGAAGMPWNPFGTRLFAAMVLVLEQSGVPFDLSMDATPPGVERVIRARNPRAVISNLRPQGEGDWSFLRRLRGERPFVMIPTGLHDTGSHRVSIAEAHAMELLVGHLMGRGYRRIAFLSFGGMNPRVHAWQQLMRERGLDISPDTLYLGESNGRNTWARKREGARSFLRRSCIGTARPVEVVMAGNDVVAREVMNLAGELGLRVPEDVGITGVDGMEGEGGHPILTTVAVDLRETARQAVALALRLSEGPAVKTPRVIHVPGRLVIGTSVGKRETTAPSWQDRFPALLEEHIKSKDPAREIAAAFGWSREYFLKKVGAEMGHGFPRTLRDHRMALARRALALGKTTPDAMERSGYGEARTFYRHVREVYGTTPEGLRP